MAHTIRIALGTASTKTSGTTLTVSSANPPVGCVIVVGVAFDNAAGAPTSVKWNGHSFGQRKFEDNATSGHALAIYTKRYVHKDVTADVIVTWGSAITSRAMFVTAIDEANFIDGKAGRVHTTETQTPATGGATATLAKTNDFVVAAFGSAGPSSDTAGTLEIRDNGTFVAASVGQRVGTTGAPPTGNVTIAEAYLELSSTTGTRARINGDATSRLWATGLLALTNSLAITHSVGPSDRSEVEAIFASQGRDIANLVYQWNEELERFEAYDVTDVGTLVAKTARKDKDWIEV